MRQFLRYEITGLFMILHITLVIFLFLELEDISDLIKSFTNSVAAIVAAIGLISLLIGWLAYQIFEECYTPHYKVSSFKLIRDTCQNLEDTECFALIDFILMNDMYQKYPGLADTIRGYWDHYYSCSIIGIGAPSISALSFIILLFMEDISTYIICPCSSAPRFVYLSLLTIYNVFLYALLWQIKANRIFKEIEFQECLYVKTNIYRLEEHRRLIIACHRA